VPVNLDNVQRLPLEGGGTGGAFQTFDTVLNGTSFTIDTYWNTRDAAWYMNLRDVNGDLIFSGIKIVIGVALGRRVTDPRMPGVFLASDLAATTPNTQRDATYDDLGSRVVVDFYPFAEFFAS
jgi:hypothetical protein